jgi:hypothetical protein
VGRVLGYRSRGPGFDSRHYHIFWLVLGLEQGPLILASTTEELFKRNSKGFGLENQDYVRGDPSRWSRDTLYPWKLTLTSPTRGVRSAGRVRSRTKAMEFLTNAGFFLCSEIRMCYSCVYCRPVCWVGVYMSGFLTLCWRGYVLNYGVWCVFSPWPAFNTQFCQHTGVAVYWNCVSSKVKLSP